MQHMWEVGLLALLHARGLSETTNVRGHDDDPQFALYRIADEKFMVLSHEDYLEWSANRRNPFNSSDEEEQPETSCDMVKTEPSQQNGDSKNDESCIVCGRTSCLEVMNICDDCNHGYCPCCAKIIWDVIESNGSHFNTCVCYQCSREIQTKSRGAKGIRNHKVKVIVEYDSIPEKMARRLDDISNLAARTLLKSRWALWQSKQYKRAVSPTQTIQGRSSSDEDIERQWNQAYPDVFCIICNKIGNTYNMFICNDYQEAYQP